MEELSIFQRSQEEFSCLVFYEDGLLACPARSRLLGSGNSEFFVVGFSGPDSCVPHSPGSPDLPEVARSGASSGIPHVRRRLRPVARAPRWKPSPYVCSTV